MNNEVIEQTTVTRDYPAGTVQTRTVTSGKFSDFFASKANQVIFAILGIINALILLRLLLLLVGANQIGFVNFMMNLTSGLVAPFQGIFPSVSSGNSYLEAASVAAIIIYSIFAVILGMILGLFLDEAE